MVGELARPLPLPSTGNPGPCFLRIPVRFLGIPAGPSDAREVRETGGLQGATILIIRLPPLAPLMPGQLTVSK